MAGNAWRATISVEQFDSPFPAAAEESMDDSTSHQIKPFPRARRLVTDVGHVVKDRPVIRGLLEIDVTDVRERIRNHEARTGEKLSFTAYLVCCAGKAIDAHKGAHACRDWLGRLVIFDDVDISTMIEIEKDGHRFPVGHIVRGANRKSMREIHDEIREVQNRPTSEKNVRRLMAISRVPSVLRRLMLKLVDRSPSWTKKLKGTAVLTSIGMFGTGAGWGLALPTHSLGITVGGIATKPGFVDGEVEPREILHVTLDFDHDIVDGAPAARFAQTFAEMVASANGLPC
jgi:pyruvate/2-oxoglutarate dehydrogenase complex dihydrolipoamide acyltransferase (E2) component